MKDLSARAHKVQLSPDVLTILIMIVFYSVGIAGLIIPGTGSFFTRLIPVVIMLSLVVCLAFHPAKPDNRTLLLFSFIVFSSWIVEYAGVNTGKIFGDYRYGTLLGPSAGGTPFILGFNWLLIVYCSASVAAIFNSGFLQIFAGASLMVLYDLVLEISAPHLGMWWFDDGVAPWNNYVAWFGLAIIYNTLFRIFRIPVRNRVAQYLFLIQFMFFLALALLFKQNR